MTMTLIADTSAGMTSTHVKSTRFGTFEAEDDLVITLVGGLIGFESCRRFVIVTPDEGGVIRWLQALDEPAVAFPIIDPWLFKADYAPEITRRDADELELDEATPRLIFAIVTVPRDNPRGITANLVGPIVVNAHTRCGKQVVVTNEEYGTKHRIIGDEAAAA